MTREPEVFRGHGRDRVLGHAARVAILAAIIPLMIPPSEALGTETLPELVDQGDDVTYYGAYAGERNHDYLDVLAAWFEHDQGLDLVSFNVKVADSQALPTSSTQNWEVRCSFLGAVTSTAEGGETVWGNLSYGWVKPWNSSGLESSANWEPNEFGQFGTRNSVPLSHVFEATIEEPGYFRFFIERGLVQRLGDRVEDIRGDCRERLKVADAPTVLEGFSNIDNAESKGAYSFAELRRARAPNGTVDDPLEGGQTLAPPVETTEQSESTPFPSWALVAVVGAAHARRRWQAHKRRKAGSSKPPASWALSETNT